MSRFEDEDVVDKQKDLIARAERVMLRNYRQQPVVFKFGHGVELWDVNRNRYLDMTSGIAVCSLGHAHPALRRALSDQANLLLHTSNLYYNEQVILAAEALVERCFADRVFFCNSGAEANEAALKLVRRYQHVVANKPERNIIVAAEGSFHGRTMATLAITGQEKYRMGFGPTFEPVRFVPFGDLAAAREALSSPQACAMIVEPIQAEGGLNVPGPDYLAGLRKIADETGTLLIFDEVQTGMGRTGKWFGHQHDDAVPDVMTMAKALGGGVPIGAIGVSEKAAAGLTYTEGAAVPHASTFGGNPLACAAALAVIHAIEDEGLLENCTQAGDYLGSRLEKLVGEQDAAIEARGRGLLRGVAVKGNPAQIVGKCRERGVLLSVAGANVIRFAPPLTVRKKHIDEAIAVLTEVLGSVPK